jgi:hypothetical protein
MPSKTCEECLIEQNIKDKMSNLLLEDWLSSSSGVVEETRARM